MPGLDALGLMVAALAVAILSPGPAIISAIQTSFAHGRAVALPYGLGLAVGASLWGLFAILGLTVIFTIVPTLYLGLKIFGAGYLLWLALGLWRGASAPMPAAATARFGTGFWGGIALNLSNPKPALFYSSLIVTIFPGPLSAAGQGAIYAASLSTEVALYAAVTLAMSTAPVRARYARAKVWIDRTAAMMLGGLGLSLAAEALSETVRT